MELEEKYLERDSLTGYLHPMTVVASRLVVRPLSLSGAGVA